MLITRSTKTFKMLRWYPWKRTLNLIPDWYFPLVFTFGKQHGQTVYHIRK